MPKLSIVVPVYNNEKTLSRCIESVLHQTFTDFELILINDGSCDSSEKICLKYSNIDKRVTVYTKTNGGVSSARNYGMNVSKGEYITFVDADDYLNPDCYKTVENNIQKEDLIFYHYIINKDGTCTKIYNRNLNKLANENLNFHLLYQDSIGYIKDDMFIDESISIFIWRCWFKTSFLRRNNIVFDETLKTGEDRIFLMNVLVNNPKIKLCDDLFGYIHTVSDSGDSLTNQKDLKKYIPWMYQQQLNMDAAEQKVCNINGFLTKKDKNNIRKKRAFSMRSLVFVNEFKNNKVNAVSNIKKYRKDEFFKWSYNYLNLFYLLKKKDKKELLKFVLIKFRFYFLANYLYNR